MDPSLLDLAYAVSVLLGVLAFAVSGALQAVAQRMDIVGVLSLAVVTAVGGGLLRDLLIGAVPPAALTDPSLVPVALGGGLLVFAASGRVPLPRRPAVHEIVTRITRLRELSGATMTDDDVVVEGDSWGGFGQVRPPLGQWAEAGATWWVESWWDLPETAAGLAELRERIEVGPRRDLGG